MRVIMKIILSRKGFDSDFGGYPSPILPDGRMVSLPVPFKHDTASYGSIFCGSQSHYELMKDIMPCVRLTGEKLPLNKDTKCHLDPDLRRPTITRMNGWKPVFGQADGAETHLENQGVKEGDLFLFFGWFRKTILQDGSLVFDRKDRGRQIIYGYLQIGGIIRVRRDPMPEWAKYHSHANAQIPRMSNNSIYIAKDGLSWSPEIPGAGCFYFDERLVLTKDGYSRSRWKKFDFLKSMSHHSEASMKKDFFQSAAIGQEFVIKNNEEAEKWAKELIVKQKLLV
jgi:hypothetical protein